MSKIICDVCGTSYPETATQCPICGCVRPGDVNTVSYDTNDISSRPSGTYTYVKGGRFSKSNVKKRNQGMQPTSTEPVAPSDKPENPKKSDKGFLIAVILLLAAIVAIVIYIAVRFFGPALDGANNDAPSTTNTVEQTQTTSDTTEADLACNEIVLSRTSISFDRVGAAIDLNITLEPENTTDVLQFVSSDEGVATVDENGRITAVGSGEAVITVSCGSVETSCNVVCTFETGATEESDPTTGTVPETTAGNQTFDPASLKLNWSYTMIEDPEVGDVTLTTQGYQWVAYTDREGKIPSSEITFSSSDESVATVDENGVVTAVGPGEAYITAEYQGHKVKCRVFCTF